MVNNKIMERSREVNLVKWSAPRNSSVKLNVDGGHDRSGISDCSGIVKDDQGSWLGGFSKCLQPFNGRNMEHFHWS